MSRFRLNPSLCARVRETQREENLFPAEVLADALTVGETMLSPDRLERMLDGESFGTPLAEWLIENENVFTPFVDEREPFLTEVK